MRVLFWATMGIIYLMVGVVAASLVKGVGLWILH